MLGKNARWKRWPVLVRLSVVAMATMALAVGTVAAQDPPLVAPGSAPGNPAIPFGRFGGRLSLPAAATAGSNWWQLSNASPGEFAGSLASTEGKPVRSEGIRQITLEQVKQQSSANRAISPLARLGQLSIEVARQHRLGLQADYFPKLGATFANLHYSEFLGQVVSVRRPIEGSVVNVPVPLFSQNQTIAALTFIQPITPLFQVNQAVRIARADERIAMAKAGVSVTKNARDLEIEETYFRLLIARRRLISAESKLKSTGNRPLYASASIENVRAPD
jgi:Outer membrane efflux protein